MDGPVKTSSYLPAKQMPTFPEIKEYFAWAGGCIIASIPIIKMALPYINRVIERDHQRKFMEGLRRLGSINVVLEDASRYSATRCIVFGAHDDGGMPRPGAPFYTDALYWKVPQQCEFRVSHYKQITADAEYIKMLIEIQEKGYIRFDFSEKAPDSMLRRIYETEHVTDSLVVYLHIRDHTFFYLTFARHEGRFTPNEITDLLLMANCVANEIKDSPKSIF